MPEYRAGTGECPGQRQRHIPDRPEETVSTSRRQQWPEYTLKLFGVPQKDKIVGQKTQVNGSPVRSDGQNEQPEDGSNIRSAKSSLWIFWQDSWWHQPSLAL